MARAVNCAKSKNNYGTSGSHCVSCSVSAALMAAIRRFGRLRLLSTAHHEPPRPHVRTASVLDQYVRHAWKTIGYAKFFAHGWGSPADFKAFAAMNLSMLHSQFFTALPDFTTCS